MLLVRPALAIVFLQFVGCSEDTNPFGDCSELVPGFEACGGEIMGTWIVDQACVGEIRPHHILFTVCPSVTLSAELGSAGRIVVDPTLFLPLFTRQDLFLHIEIPMRCLEGIGLNCAYVEEQLDAEPDVTATCTEEDDLCKCDSIQDMIESWVGEFTYRLEDGLVVAIDMDGEEYTIRYCVRGRHGVLLYEMYSSQASADAYVLVHLD